MRTILSLSLASALLAACSAPKDAKPAAESAVATPAETAAPRAVVTAIYLWPKDTVAFEKYYPTHLKVVGDRQAEIGFTSAEVTRFTSDLQGGRPEYYRQAELYFPSMDAARAGMATAGFKAVSDDFKNFVAPGGVLWMVAEETGPASDAPCPALATILYGTPTDAAAFEAGYARHLEVVGRAIGDVGSTRTDATRFTSNVDGTAPTLYRQAELCFPDMPTLLKGVGSPSVAPILNDIPNFSTGGQRGMIGIQQ